MSTKQKGTEKMSDTGEPSPSARGVPALVIESATRVTPQQRARNIAAYNRLKDGQISPRHGGQESGLSGFVYDVPIERLSIAPSGKTFSFRLQKDDECFWRLLSVISDHFDGFCDADDQVDKMQATLRLVEELALSLEHDHNPELRRVGDSLRHRISTP